MRFGKIPASSSKGWYHYLCACLCVCEAAGAKTHLCIARSNPDLWFCFEEIHRAHRRKTNKKKIHRFKHLIQFMILLQCSAPSGKMSPEAQTHMCLQEQTQTYSMCAELCTFLGKVAASCPGAHIRNLDHNQADTGK